MGLFWWTIIRRDLISVGIEAPQRGISKESDWLGEMHEPIFVLFGHMEVQWLICSTLVLNKLLHVIIYFRLSSVFSATTFFSGSASPPPLIQSPFVVDSTSLFQTFVLQETWNQNMCVASQEQQHLNTCTIKKLCLLNLIIGINGLSTVAIESMMHVDGYWIFNEIWDHGIRHRSYSQENFVWS